MSWRELIKEEPPIALPWTGKRELRLGPRSWVIKGPLPAEHGWVVFSFSGRDAKYIGPSLAPDASASVYEKTKVRGYLVGDRLVRDDAMVDPNPQKIVDHSERVYLLDDGLDRFARVSAGRCAEDGDLVFLTHEFPLGPEPLIQRAFEDGARTVEAIPNVSPALDAAFRMELFQRDQAELRRQELERRRREEEEQRAREEKREALVRQLGDGAGRRAMAQHDFGAAAKAALAVGGAEYLDHRNATRKNEVVVRFRLDRKRFECTCDKNTLQIIDAGICLIDHKTNERGDTYFTLESLPGVIRQAEREHKLVVFRHVD